jgi:hypothetical protein
MTNITNGNLLDKLSELKKSTNPTMIKFEDSFFPFDAAKKIGYYQVGSKYYLHKTYALIEATRTNQPATWEFNTNVYKKIDWQTPILTSINELYRMRAQQLRDNYDYLILSFSGGADSSNVLDSFLLNNIHLDEIVIHWPLKHTEGKFKVSNDTSQFNILSEWELAAKPKLEYVRKHYPKIKITVTDVEELTPETTDALITLTRDKFDYANIKRNREIFKISSKLINQGQQVATIYGMSKPLIFVDKNIFCGYFDDAALSVISGTDDGYERTVEYFYWTPDLPELVIKQCQILYTYFKNNPDMSSLLDRYSRTVSDHNVIDKIKYKQLESYSDSQIFRSLISQLIYPSWDNSTFQADKPENFIKCEHHAWTRSFGSQTFLDAWESTMTSFFNQIDKKHFDADDIFKKYRSLTSRLYPVGTFNTVESSN